jgi:hypothetical protein
MSASKAHMRATAKWEKENYAQLVIMVPKGKKELIKKCAASKGESMNSFITRLIYKEMGYEPPLKESRENFSPRKKPNLNLYSLEKESD